MFLERVRARESSSIGDAISKHARKAAAFACGWHEIDGHVVELRVVYANVPTSHKYDPSARLVVNFVRDNGKRGQEKQGTSRA